MFHVKHLIIMNRFGLYIHVPFCRTKCTYCGFYRVTDLSYRKKYIDSVVKELGERAELFKNKRLKSIYFGGGTPSVLQGSELKRLIWEVEKYWKVDEVEEFTVEVNPDDVTEDYLRELKEIGVNRISMGVQCLDDKILKLINRRHSVDMVYKAVDMVKSQFDNVSLDYIFGLPQQTVDTVSRDVSELLKMGVQHLSIYALSVEENSILEKQIEKGIVALPDEEVVLGQYDVITKKLREKGWRHYEISNYACDDEHLAVHNSSYWVKVPYLGIGPAASSFDGERKRWTNCEDVKKYIEGENDVEYDDLEEEDLINERIMLGLRTDRGVSISEFDVDTQRKIKENRYLVLEDGLYKIPEKGWMVYNRIVSSLFV